MYSMVEKKQTHILNDVAVIGDEEEGTAVWQVDLHANQAVGMSR